MNIFDVKISYFERCSGSRYENQSIIPLKYFLTSTKYIPEVDRIRNTSDYNERKILKRDTLSCATISGTFSGRGEQYLIEHSGFICIDIDHKDNTHVGNFADLKVILSGIPEVAYCGMSVSGEGYFCLFRIEHTQRHKEHFTALYNAFESLGIKIDTAPKNPSSLRFISYDPEAYWNANAPIFSHYIEATPPPKHTKYIPARAKVQTSLNELPVNADGTLNTFAVLVRKIVQSRTDITSGNYGVEGWKVWANLARSIAGEYGQSGRDDFHTISQFYPNYSKEETDTTYNKALNDTSHGRDINYFFKVCSSYGITYADELAEHNENRKRSDLPERPHTTIIPPSYPSEWDTITPPEAGTPEYREMIRAEIADSDTRRIDLMAELDPRIADIANIFDAQPI